MKKKQRLYVYLLPYLAQKYIEHSIKTYIGLYQVHYNNVTTQVTDLRIIAVTGS